MKKSLPEFDQYMDGWYAVQCLSAGKCLGCGQAIPEGEPWSRRFWLKEHWRIPLPGTKVGHA